MNHYRKIDRLKVQFDFLMHCMEETAYDAEIRSLGGIIYRLPRLNPFSITYRKALNEFFRLHKEYKIAHSHLNCMSALPLKYAKKNDVPIRIAHGHSASLNKNLKLVLKLFYKQFIPRYATEIFACGEKAGNWMFGKNRYQVFHNAIDAEPYIHSPEIAQKVRNDLHITKDALVVGHVGRMDNAKNQSFVIDVFYRLQQVHRNCGLILVGDGPLREDLEKKAASYGISDIVHFLGIRSDVHELMQAMDCLLFPSLFEGLSLVMIEAQAAGLPILASTAVSEESAITNLVEFLSLEELPEKWAEKLWEHIQRTERRNTFDEIVSSKYDIKANAKWLEEFYINQNALV